MEVASPIPQLQREAIPQLPCKICGGVARWFGSADFNHNCSEDRGAVLPAADMPVHYHRCSRCSFLFTTAFDHFTAEDFTRFIYNDAYRLVDPDYEDARPRALARMFAKMFPDLRSKRILDYGGGNGKLAEFLRERGFEHVDVYDPFVARHANRPQGKYDCVISVEVAEHSTDPRGTFADWERYRADGGAIVATTVIQPDDIVERGMNWWYIGPRNGHVSLFSRDSLAAAAMPLGLNGISFDSNVHILYREVPSFATPLVARAPTANG
jgi:2-polyprenyl-6-hydroxyphenyl methylase/3-demethylubiquinone-9 3-methyltransferase